MARLNIAAVSLSLLAAVAWSTAVRADTTDAMCEFKKDGKTWQGRTGPCTFSQRQGYVSIVLRSGDRFELAPTNQANHLKDPDGNKVVRTVGGSGEHYYAWDNKKIIVRFDNPGEQSSAGHPARGESGQTPADLRDLVGQQATLAEPKLSARGYDFIKSSVSGQDVYSSWRNRSSGQCVMIHQVKGRYDSIVNTGPGDCK